MSGMLLKFKSDFFIFLKKYLRFNLICKERVVDKKFFIMKNNGVFVCQFDYLFFFKVKICQFSFILDELKGNYVYIIGKFLNFEIYYYC